MGRRRAGHGCTWINRNGRSVKMISSYTGAIVPTFAAKFWPRCGRCRRPADEASALSGFCSTCYFYEIIPRDQFWPSHDPDHLLTKYAPYNIGRNVIAGFMALRAANPTPPAPPPPEGKP